MRGLGRQADFQVVKLCAVLAAVWRRVHLTWNCLRLDIFQPLNLESGRTPTATRS